MAKDALTLHRREFLRALTYAPVLAPLSELGDDLDATSSGDRLLSRLEIVGPKEPGTRLVISGTVYAPDGRTPLRNMRIDVYHTDAGGYYSRPVNDPRRARLRGSLVTDRRGRYEIHTIQPGKYFDRDAPRHIHAHLSGPGVPVHWIDSYLFEGDPYLSADDVAKNRNLDRWSAIVKLEADRAGVLRAARDIRVDPAVVVRNRLVDGWYAR